MIEGIYPSVTYPNHTAQTTGPAFRPRTDPGRRSMLDEAPTLAAVLGLELPDAEGAVLQDVLAQV